jgi:ribonucleoside-diphosphate reductase beta chain
MSAQSQSTNEYNKEEPLLAENPNRFVIFPIQYQDMWNLAVTHREAFWNESEIDLMHDKKDWEKLNDNEKESIHSITYSILLDTYITEPKEKDRMFRAIETIPSVAQKALWAQKWIESSDSFAIRLLAFACVEGLFFSGSICCIYWLKERGILPGLCQSNDLIARDEGLHVDFAVLLYSKYIVNKLSDEVVHKIVREAVKIEESFIIDSIPCRLLGMNSDMMREYIRFVANRQVKQLGHAELYPEAIQPFPFMERICFSSKGNFFEKESTQYRVPVEHTNEELSFDAYF